MGSGPAGAYPGCRARGPRRAKVTRPPPPVPPRLAAEALNIWGMSDLTVRDLYAIMAREYKGRDPSPFLGEQFPRGTRWVMDLAWYKRVRAACATYGTIDPEDSDPEKWVPDPGDRLFGLPVEVREDGGEPHLEEPSAGAAAGIDLDMNRPHVG